MIPQKRSLFRVQIAKYYGLSVTMTDLLLQFTENDNARLVYYRSLYALRKRVAVHDTIS